MNKNESLVLKHCDNLTYLLIKSVFDFLQRKDILQTILTRNS